MEKLCSSITSVGFGFVNITSIRFVDNIGIGFITTTTCILVLNTDITSIPKPIPRLLHHNRQAPLPICLCQSPKKGNVVESNVWIFCRRPSSPSSTCPACHRRLPVGGEGHYCHHQSHHQSDHCHQSEHQSDQRKTLIDDCAAGLDGGHRRSDWV